MLRCLAGVSLVIYHQHWQRLDVLDRTTANWAVLWRARAIAYGAAGRGWPTEGILDRAGKGGGRYCIYSFSGTSSASFPSGCAPRVNHVGQYRVESALDVMQPSSGVCLARPWGYSHLFSALQVVPRRNGWRGVSADGKDCFGPESARRSIRTLPNVRELGVRCQRGVKLSRQVKAQQKATPGLHLR